MDLRLYQIWYSSVHAHVRISPDNIATGKFFCSIFINSAANCPISLKKIWHRF